MSSFIIKTRGIDFMEPLNNTNQLDATTYVI